LEVYRLKGTTEKRGRKITVLGAGNVGATIAYTLTLKGICSELVLVDINKPKAMGEAMDIRQGISFCPSVNIYNGDYEDTKDSDIVIITVGIARKPGQTRIDLARTNVGIIKSVMPEITKYCPDAVYVVVSNPVDILAYAVNKFGAIPKNRIIGSGTMLDSARLRSIVADRLQVSADSIHAYVFGEHGDTSFAPWSLTTIAGMSMFDYYRSIGKSVNPEVLKQVEIDVRNAGASVIAAKGATFYAIALSVSRICECVLRDSKSVMTVSSMTDGIYGTEDVCLSLPYVVGADGIISRIKVNLTPDEDEALRNSSKALKAVIDELEV
jgi:L-lactate dehydrogenase